MGLGDILAGLAGFANPFGAPSADEWNLTKGVYTTKVSNKSVIFFYETPKGEPRSKRTAIDQVTDTGGRRLAVYEYAYRDGQGVADLGRKGETFNFNVKFYGLNYQDKLNEFLSIVNSSEGGTLLHPVRGSVSAKFRDYEFLHRYDEWSSVTIRATFIEDQTDALAATNLPAASQDSALRSALQALTNAQASISQGIFAVGAVLLLPGAIKAAMVQRLNSITGQISALFGALAATFSSDAQLQNLAAQSSQAGGVSQLNAGATAAATLPPVYQVGFDPTTQTAIDANLQAFVGANQITPQQAVFQANQARAAITAAIAEAEQNLGNDGYDTVVQYRTLAIAIQTAVEAAISTAKNQVTIYTVPFPMSLRTVAFKNGLPADDQNVIEALNPYLGSVNLVPTGTQLVVPAA